MNSLAKIAKLRFLAKSLNNLPGHPKDKMKAMKPVATGNSVLRAYNKAVKKMQTEPFLATAQSAGFIIPDGQQDGYQVFVKVYKFSRRLLKKCPGTGGLLAGF